MLEDLRQYITNKFEDSYDGYFLRSICERSYDSKLTLRTLNSFSVNIELIQEMYPFFSSVASDYHLVDMELEEDTILKLMSSVFGKSVDVCVERYPTFYLLKKLYLSDSLDQTYKKILSFLEDVAVGVEDNSILDILTDPNVNEDERDLLTEEAIDDEGYEHTTLFVKFSIDPNEERYEDFCIFMDEIGTLKIDDGIFWNCNSGYDYGSGFIYEMCDIDIDDYFELIKDFPILNFYDEFDDVFENVGSYESVFAFSRNVINRIMNAKTTAMEVLM